MKKAISILLTMIMTMTLVFTAYADNDRGKGHGSGEKTVVTSTTASAPAVTLDSLLQLLKGIDINSELKNKLIKQIIDFRKKKGDNTIPVFYNNTLLTLSSPAVTKGYAVFLPATTLSQIAGAAITEGDSQLIAPIPASGQNASITYIIVDKRSGKITKNGSEQRTRENAQFINRKLYIPSDLFSGSLGFKVQYDKANGALMIYSSGYKPAALAAPTAVTVTPVGGIVVANTLNSTNINLTAAAAITPGQAAGGKAELLLGASVLASDTSISSTDTAVTFDLGKTTSAQLQAAVTTGGAISVKLYDAAGNMAVSAVGNPTLLVDYSAPAVISAAFSSPTTLTIVFSEAVIASAADFSDGRFIDASDGNNAKTFTVIALTGSGTNTLTLIVAPIVPIQTGDTGSVDIAPTVKDLNRNSLVPLDNRIIASGF